MKFMKKIMAAVAASAVAAVSVVGASLSVYALQPATGAPYTVYMAVSAGSEQQWNPGEMATTTDASIEKDGDYSCSVTFEQGSATIEYLSLDSNINVYSFVEEGGDPFKDGTAKIKINSIEIKHTDGSTGTIAMQESATSLRTADDGKCLRYSILDNWGSGTHENNIDKDLSSAGGLGAGDTLVVNFNISGIEAVAQAIKQRLLLLYAEWWEDLKDGLPLWEQILGTSGSEENRQAVDIIIRDRISGTRGVQSVTSFESSFERRHYKFTATVETIYGSLTISSEEVQM